MKRSTIHILLILLFSNQSFSQSNNSYYNVFNSISASAISNHLNVLANDSLEGRAVGTKGAEIAANYISNFFSNLNLKRISKDNSYFQNIPMHGSNPLTGSELVFILDKDTMNLSFAEDYYLYRSGQQTFMPAFLPIVFVGYGIVAPEFDYNDYQSVDVEGKIVVYLDGEPISDDEEFFDGPSPTIYANPESKRRIAFAQRMCWYNSDFYRKL